jgi:phosphoribosylaminoimidazole (AIR) synthetase
MCYNKNSINYGSIVSVDILVKPIRIYVKNIKEIITIIKLSGMI